jgi:TonB family protein
MFETSVVQARAQAAARRPLLLSLSIGAHAAVVIGAVAASVATVSLPRNAPHQFTIPVFSEIKPMLGDGSAQKKTPAVAPPQAVKRQAAPSTVVAPSVVPDQVVPATTQAADVGPVGANPGPAMGDNAGPGVPWGTPDGVVPDGPPASGAPTVIYVPGGDVKAPVVLRRVSPPYPEVARRMRLNGFVILECIIDQTGHIRDAHVVRSSFAAFEQPALDAVYQWQFAPGTLGGRPVDVQFDLKVTFQVN